MHAVTEVRGAISCVSACDALGLPRATYYRRRRQELCGANPDQEGKGRPRSPRSLSEREESAVLEVLHSPRFQDRAVPQVWATLLDEGRYLCSQSTMYRILHRNSEVRERRNQLRRPNYAKPELLATAPNQVWSWDITKLKGPQKWTYFYLYVLLDIFSRCVVGWMVARCETALLAKKLWAETVRKHEIEPGQLTCHSDRGSPMTAKSFALLLADLGITQSLNRPHVSDDNPFAEAQFKTLKYDPSFPGSFGSLEDARAWCGPFFDSYNSHHHHSGLGWMTPADVHYGRVAEVNAERARALDSAYQANPERFVRRPPVPPAVPSEVWINPPVVAGAAQ